MDVDSFIAKYRPDWERLERLTAAARGGARRLSGPEIDEAVVLYLRASAHLAESARYGDTALRGYLGRVVGNAHGAIYSTRPRTVGGFVALFGVRYREALRRTMPFVLTVAVLLAGIIAATLVWVATSRAARAGLIPPAAEAAIRDATGDRADFGIGSPAVSAFILFNNVRVAIIAFALGVGLGIGTIYVVVQNAFFIGALAGGFTAAGKAGIFWSLVLPHGLLELTAISIAAGAGLRIGWALVDPGDRARGRALAEETRDSLLVLVGVVPAFLAAALIEGFLTGTAVPDPIEIGIGAAAAVGYVAFLTGLRRRPATAGRAP